MMSLQGRGRLLALAGLLLAVVAIASCDDETTEGGEGGGGTVDPGPTFAESDCGICVAEACANLVTQCNSDPGCAGYLGCLNGCTVDAAGQAETSCDQACPQPADTAGVAARDELNRCRLETAACGACGHAAEAANPFDDMQCPPVDEPNPCLDCFREECCETLDTCFLVNVHCDALFGCIDLCEGSMPYADCHKTCFEQHPKGVEDYVTDHACSNTQCATACGFGGLCTDCVADKCAASELACSLDPACFVATICIGECMQSACDTAACVDDLSPESLALFEAKAICPVQKCGLECKVM